MKHKSTLLTVFFLFCTAALLFASNPKEEFRASWVATVWGIDWPHSQGNVSAQKAEMDLILDRAKAANMTAVMLQVRSYSDALYRSTVGEPWSSVLTGTRGKDPGYDPLAYAVEQAHARGLELHAWINPYRLGNNTLRSSQIQDSWILLSGSKQILDPGNPAVRAYVLSVIEDIIDHYDIDGIIFDDYFYNGIKTDYSSTQAPNETPMTTANNPHNLSLGDWRRENVNLFVKSVMQSVAAKKPYLRFGIGPAGVWSTSAHNVYNEDYTSSDYISACPGSWDVYSDLFCDGAAWLKRGYIDYISPQLYWPMLSTSNGYYASSSFSKLCPWWADLAFRYNRHFYVSQDVANNNTGTGTNARFNSPDEIAAQMNELRSNGKVKGSIFYNTKYLFNIGGCNSYFSSSESYHTFLANDWYSTKSVVPAIDWREAPELAKPSDISLVGSNLMWTHVSSPRFTVYAYPKGMDRASALEDPAWLLGVTYATSFNVSSVGDLANTTFAVCPYDRYGNEYEPIVYNEGESSFVAGTVSMTPLWSKTVSEAAYLTTGAANRSMAYYNGQLYIPDKNTGTFAVVNAETGSLQTMHTIGTSAFWQHNLRITDDGKLLMGNTAAGSTSLQIKMGSVSSDGYDDLASVSITGRCDYFYPYGTWSDKGFALALSNTGHLLKVPFAGGSLQTAVAVDNSDLPSGTSAKAVPCDANSFYASVAGQLPTRHLISTGEKMEEFPAGTTAIAVNASGVGTFTLLGHRYLVLPADVNGGFEVYETTYGLGKAKRVISATPVLGSATNASYTIDFCTAVEGNDAYIYVLAPDNGLAAYKFTFTPVADGVQETLDNLLVLSTPQGLALSFEGTQVVEIYGVNGVLICRETAAGSFACALPHGAYIVRVGEQVRKFIH